MATASLPVEQIMQTLRENRSSESNFSTLKKELDNTISAAQQAGNHNLSADLEEIREKYVSEYEKAIEVGGTAWPAFEKFVTQFERALADAKNGR